MSAPIAIVGQACVLPGALDVTTFADNVFAGRDLVTEAPEGRWGLPHADVMGDGRDRAWSSAGGYVTGFDAVWNPSGFDLPAAEFSGLDPLVHWLAHVGRAALQDAGIDIASGSSRSALARCGAVFGNLSFPSEGMARWGERVVLQANGRRASEADPRDRFMSGLPADLLSRALGLGAPCFALDAACASSLYAIKLACDALTAGRADIMLAGAVQRADSLFLHIGFCSLGAMSHVGMSRPFHREADGLVPAEGAALVVLKRLDDAVRDGDRILGVIRGVGLSNDARARNLLAPSEEGQVRALRAAYATSGVAPADIQLVECHATGTPTGDRTEVATLAEVFGGAGTRGGKALPIGSLKSMVGHLITAAGVAGLQKVLAGFARQSMPPTLHADAPIPSLGEQADFRLLAKAEPWTVPSKRGSLRRAAVSAFGFGGNNAHLIVEEHVPGSPVSVAVTKGRRKGPPVVPPKIAIVGIAVSAGTGDDRKAFARDLYAGTGAPLSSKPRREQVTLGLAGLRFPPNDLALSLPQQTLLLRVALDAVAEAAVPLPRESTGIYVGLGADVAVSGYGLRWRIGARTGATGAALDALRDAIIPALRAENVVGTMPNIPANRLSVQLDAGGPGFTLSAEELSGIHALGAAVDALTDGSLQVALVGAVDLACDPRHAAAIEALAPGTLPGDAAVMLVLMRQDEAMAAGHRIWAVLDAVETAGAAAAPISQGEGEPIVAPRALGRAHAAAGLVDVAAAVLACGHGLLPGTAGAPGKGASPRAWSPPGGVRQATVSTRSLGGASARVSLSSTGTPIPLDPIPLEGGHTPPSPTGHLLTFPAHAETIVLPSDRSNQNPKTGGGLRMPAAPQLAAVLGAYEPASAATAPAPAPVSPAPAVVSPSPGTVSPSPVPVPTPMYAGADPTLTNLFAQQARVTQVHRAFLEQQAAVQARFAASRASTTQMMLNAALGSRGFTTESTEHTEKREEREAREVKGTSFAAPAPAPLHLPAPALPLPSSVSSVPSVVQSPTPAPAPTPTPAPAPQTRPGPKLSRQDLEDLARGPISRHFGPQFAPQDAYARVVRMPEPPLLLCDRVTGISGPPAVLGKGTIWTETDITEESWYLHERHIPAGVMIESGQADLLLASWQGVDLNYNRGERMYRLLGCDLRYEGGLPGVGDTLKYEIHVDGHAKLGDIRMFFFHYDCKVNDQARLTVREGQAGFFSQAELDKSGGVLWDAATAEVDLSGPLAPPAVACTKSSFSKEDLLAFTEGRVAEAFGPGFERALTHTWTPKIAGGRMLFFDRVTSFDPSGGPWKRGYLSAECDITGNNWFFDGHFFNDPCMPGTLMFEGCLQALQVYMTGLGHTLRRDGWRFEPKQGETFHLRCRGQVIPTSKLLKYELFVQEVGLDPVPYVKAQVMCTVDGLKCFHADPLTLVMVPDWPLTRMPKLLSEYVEPKPAVWDYASLLACAWGQPSHAFGPMYEVFDGTRAVARLPGPPYHFMSRVTRTDGEIGSFKAGTVIEIEYDVPQPGRKDGADWYFRENSTPAMPFAVLLEAALQPCGWLASYVGSATTSPTDLLFRNLDGTGTVLAEVWPDSGTLTTRVKINSVNRSAGMIIEGFDVTMIMTDASGTETPLYEMKTVFGFFPPAAFENQVGVGSEADDRAWLASPNDFQVDLSAHPARYFDGALRMPGDMLCMLDRVTGHWPQGGKAGLGKWRADKDVDPNEWFFKAHFYMDPVQPGSLGIEAMIQLLQFVMIHEGYGARFKSPRFEAIAVGRELKWKYRGQVVPTNKLIQTEVEITSVEGDTVTCDAHLWVDGKRIYSAWGLGMRVVEGDGQPTFPFDGPRDATPVRGVSSGSAASTVAGVVGANSPHATTVTVPVPVDHCPTYVLPALPAMTMVMLALQATGAPALKDASVTRWLSFPDGPRDVTATVIGEKVVLGAPEPFFVATACAPVAPVELPPLRDAVPGPLGADLYASGELFHGPSFHVVERVVARGSNGATLMLRPAPPDVLLDGITHGVPHDRLETWCPEIAPGQVGYPSRIESLSLYGAPPRTDGTGGPVRCEVRFLGLVSGRPRIGAHLYTSGPNGAGDVLLASIVIQEVLLPKGRIGDAAPSARRDFLLGKPGTGVALSAIEGDVARLSAIEVKGSDWLPGTIGRVFGSVDPVEIAARELAAVRLDVHPRDVVVAGDKAFAGQRPLATVSWAPTDGGARVGAASFPDMSRVTAWWRAHLGRSSGKGGSWPGEDVVAALARRYLADFVVHDPAGMEAVRGRPCLFLGNHENYLESVIFTCVAPALFGTPTRALAKVEHRDRWLGTLERLLTTYPGQQQDPLIIWFDQKDPASLPVLARGATDRSLLVHVEGTRQITPGQPVDKISSLWVDIALERGLPIVPVAFRGGVDGIGRHDVPAAAQVHHIGAPILPEALAAVPYADRRRVVAEAINALGVPAPIAPVTDPVAPGVGIRLALEGVSDGVIRDLLDGKRLPKGAEGAWLAELRGLIG